MNILVLHSSYRVSGGEDIVVKEHVKLLRENGFNVSEVYFNNSDSIVSSLEGSFIGLFSAFRIRKLISSRQIEVVYLHNTHFRIGPLVFLMLRWLQVPVVRMVHNFRFSCLNAIHYRNGGICVECVTRRSAVPGLVHRCYRGSFLLSLLVAGRNLVERCLLSEDTVTRYIAPSNVVGTKLAEAGVSPERTVVCGHFLEDFWFKPRDPWDVREPVFIFVGRLSEEKGIARLLEAWGSRRTAHAQLIIVGTGPLEKQVQTLATEDKSIEFINGLERENLLEIYGKATCLVAPSLCWETFGKSVSEAMAQGIAAIVPGGGALGELVRNGETGRVLDEMNSNNLASVIDEVAMDPIGALRMGRAAYEATLERLGGEGAKQRTIAAITQI